MTDASPPSPRGPKLEDDAELVLRQVHPMFVQEGRVTSQAFRPSKSDVGLLSVARASHTTAEDAFRLHTEGKKLASVGVWGLSVADCRSESLAVFADPEPGPPPDPAHALLDFRGLTRSEAEARSKRLLVRANERGRQYPL